MEKLYELFAKTLAATALVVASICMYSLVCALPLKWAWNGVMPELFGLGVVTYWEAFALIWVSGLLVKASPQRCDDGKRK